MAASYQRKPQLTCRRGHPYTEENTRWIDSSRTWSGKCRVCLICNREKLKRRPREQATERMRLWRAKNGERHRSNWRFNRYAKKQVIDSYKTQCSLCPETHPACLEFHHRDPSKKEFLLSVAVSRYSMARIQQELDKCDVLCSNCHRKLHYAERHEEAV